MSGRGLGYTPDPALAEGVEPDWDALRTTGSATVPYSHSLRRLIVNVLDQGALGSCVAHAGFQAIRAAHVRQGVKTPALGSRLFGYFVSRSFHHETDLDNGTHLRTFFQALNKFGFPPESFWPYDDTREGAEAPFRSMPPTIAFKEAFDQKAPTVYRRIYETGASRVVAVKRAISSGYLVCFGTAVSQNFVDGNLGARPVQPPDDNEPIAGGHAMTIVGFDGDVFDVVNSWGTSWGSGGFCTLAPEYIASPKSRDFWIVEHSPRFG